MLITKVTAFTSLALNLSKTISRLVAVLLVTLCNQSTSAVGRRGLIPYSAQRNSAPSVAPEAAKQVDDSAPPGFSRIPLPIFSLAYAFCNRGQFLKSNRLSRMSRRRNVHDRMDLCNCLGVSPVTPPNNLSMDVGDRYVDLVDSHWFTKSYAQRAPMGDRE